MNRIHVAALAFAFAAGAAWSKIPPPPPPDEKAKADQAAAEDKAVKNFQANMKKAGKPIPKPTPVVAAAAPAAAPKAAEKKNPATSEHPCAVHITVSSRKRLNRAVMKYRIVSLLRRTRSRISHLFVIER